VAAYLEGQDQESIQLILVDVVTLWTVKRPSEAQAIPTLSEILECKNVTSVMICKTTSSSSTSVYGMG
jgi:hypothetical protein